MGYMVGNRTRSKGGGKKNRSLHGKRHTGKQEVLRVGKFLGGSLLRLAGSNEP